MYRYPNGLVRPLLLAAAGLLLACSSALAQKGTVAGVLTDAETGETLIGANALIEGTAIGATTDVDGRFAFKADAGTYTVVFSYIGYNAARVQDVEVKAGEVTRLDLSLTSEVVGIEEVVVEARALRSTEGVLLRERQRAAALSDAISAETISRSGSSTASDAMQKVTGASVVGGKYVYVRGLGERYMNTQLNGTTLPSADPDRNAVPLDLFPSGLLDNIVTTKTFTPDKPGSFTGGSVNISTRDYPDVLSLTLSSSVGYNTQTNGSSDFLTFANGSPGFLGFNSSDHALPRARQNAVIPTLNEAFRDPEKAAELDRLSKSFEQVMGPRTATPPVNQSYGLSVGSQVPLLGRPLGVLGSLSYSRNVSGYDSGLTGRYTLTGKVSEVDQLSPEFRLNDMRGTDEVLWGGLVKLSYKPHPRHDVGLNYIRNQSTESLARYQIGAYSNYGGSADDFYETRALGLTERRMNAFELSGEHALTRRNIKVEWTSARARSTQDEPDLRFFSNNYTDFGTETVYEIRESLYPAPTRYFRNLEEDSWTNNLSATLPLRIWNGLPAQIKVGGAYETRNRTFRERRFEFKKDVRSLSYAGDPNAYLNQFVGILPDQSTSTLTRFGLYVQDASLSANNYDGDYSVGAAFAMFEIPLTRRLRVIGGARYEATQIDVISEDESRDEGHLDNKDLLPSLSAVYEVIDNMNLRLAYGRTLARPTFRELAPYASFNFVGDFIEVGNAGLRRTLTDNYDFRWEWFARPGEIVAVSAFYKDFSNPIERVILNVNGEIQYQNVDQATVYGAEFEIRRRLDDLSPLLRNIQVGANVALVQSEVSIAPDELAIIRSLDPNAGDKRELQGQSPYVVNIDAGYDNPGTGTSVSAYYNLFGERLAEVSLGGTPDVFEKARGDLDVIISQRIASRFKLKLSGKNLLDSDYRLVQTYKGTEYDVRSYQRGRSFSIGVGYDIF